MRFPSAHSIGMTDKAPLSKLRCASHCQLDGRATASQHDWERGAPSAGSYNCYGRHALIIRHGVQNGVKFACEQFTTHMHIASKQLAAKQRQRRRPAEGWL
jgi:hypothetical protein